MGAVVAANRCLAAGSAVPVASIGLPPAPVRARESLAVGLAVGRSCATCWSSLLFLVRSCGFGLGLSYCQNSLRVSGLSKSIKPAALSVQSATPIQQIFVLVNDSNKVCNMRWSHLGQSGPLRSTVFSFCSQPQTRIL